MAWSETPAALTAWMSSGPTSSGVSVTFSSKPMAAPSFGSSGALRQSSRTCAVIPSPRAFDATAPWAPVQNGHWLSREVNAANSSRSPTAHSDGPRMMSFSSEL
jgi:hypothetical protein